MILLSYGNKKGGKPMDYIKFNIEENLKADFQIKTIKEKTNMTDVLVEFIKKYVKED